MDLLHYEEQGPSGLLIGGELSLWTAPRPGHHCESPPQLQSFGLPECLVCGGLSMGKAPAGREQVLGGYVLRSCHIPMHDRVGRRRRTVPRDYPEPRATSCPPGIEACDRAVCVSAAQDCLGQKQHKLWSDRPSCSVLSAVCCSTELPPGHQPGAAQGSCVLCACDTHWGLTTPPGASSGQGVYEHRGL